MTHLHMRQFDGITVGMEVQSPAAFRALKKNITYGEVKPRGWSRPTRRAKGGNAVNTYDIYRLETPEQVVFHQQANSPEEALEKEARHHATHASRPGWGLWAPPRQSVTQSAEKEAEAPKEVCNA